MTPPVILYHFFIFLASSSSFEQSIQIDTKGRLTGEQDMGRAKGGAVEGQSLEQGRAGRGEGPARRRRGRGAGRTCAPDQGVAVGVGAARQSNRRRRELSGRSCAPEERVGRRLGVEP